MWSTHLNHANRHGRCFLRKLFHLRKLCPNDTLITLYHSLFIGKVMYGMAVWGGTYMTHLNPLYVTQKYVIRTIARKPRIHPSLPLFRQYDALPLRYLYIWKLLRVFYPYLDELVTPQEIGVALRRREAFIVPFANSQNFTKTPSYLLPKLFNELTFVDHEMKYSEFSNKLLRWLWARTDVEEYFS